MNDQPKETPIVPSFLGLVKKGTCPVCSSPLAPGFDCPDWILCPSCGEYMTVHDKKLRQVDASYLSKQPVFAAPTPWKDMQALSFALISLNTSAEDYLKDTITDLAMVKKEGVRILDAKWPEGCCVCGKRSTQTETTVQRFNFTPPGIVRIREHEATVVAQGIPHCAEHKEGARFERATFGTEGHNTVIGLLFCSYAYQKRFRKLNPWTWI